MPGVGAARWPLPCFMLKAAATIQGFCCLHTSYRLLRRVYGRLRCVKHRLMYQNILRLT